MIDDSIISVCQIYYSNPKSMVNYYRLACIPKPRENPRETLGSGAGSASVFSDTSACWKGPTAWKPDPPPLLLALHSGRTRTSSSSDDNDTGGEERMRRAPEGWWHCQSRVSGFIKRWKNTLNRIKIVKQNWKEIRLEQNGNSQGYMFETMFKIWAIETTKHHQRSYWRQDLDQWRSHADGWEKSVLLNVSCSQTDLQIQQNPNHNPRLVETDRLLPKFMGEYENLW